MRRLTGNQPTTTPQSRIRRARDSAALRTVVTAAGLLVVAVALAGCSAPGASATTSPVASASTKHVGSLARNVSKSVTVVALPVGNCGLITGAQVAAAAGGSTTTTMSAPALAVGGTVVDACFLEVPKSDRLEGVSYEVVRFRGSAKSHILGLAKLLPGAGSADPGFEVPGLPEPVRTAVGSLAGTSTAVAETTIGPYLMWVTTTGQPSSGAAGATAATLLTDLVTKARAH